MSVTKEILIGAGAMSFGFTVATGINITYFTGVDRQVAIEINTPEIDRIPKFWEEYNNKRFTVSDSSLDDDKKKICITVDNEDICVELPIQAIK